MVELQQRATSGIHGLADHLDAVVTATEDLLQVVSGCPEPGQLLRLELVAITRVLQARQELRDFHFPDRFLAGQSKLFVAGTDVFENGNAGTEPVAERAPLSENYLIGRRVPISVLAELCSAMLGALEAWHVLHQKDQASLLESIFAGQRTS